MFCLTLKPSHLDFIQGLNYTPVGLGKKDFPKNCLSDKNGKNKLVENLLIFFYSIMNI